MWLQYTKISIITIISIQKTVQITWSYNNNLSNLMGVFTWRTFRVFQKYFTASPMNSWEHNKQNLKINITCKNSKNNHHKSVILVVVPVPSSSSSGSGSGSSSTLAFIPRYLLMCFSLHLLAV